MAGIYLHIPFCRKACHYCNFHFSTSLQQKSRFLAALLMEIRLRKDYLGNVNIQTVYFGGGTPSVLSETEIQQIFEELHRYFNINADAEITFETNPDDLTSDYLKSLRNTPINRLSIGVQSFAEADLVYMNRNHDAQTALQSIQTAQNLGFQNLTIDLIYGSPSTTHAIWEQNLQMAIGLKIPHLSCYNLTVEPKTALDTLIKKGKMPPVQEEHSAQQMQILMQMTAAAGYEHYEISNFSLPDCHARHNSNYWLGVPYLGLGASAHSFNGTERRWNEAHNAHYINSLLSEQLPPQGSEILSINEKYNEYVLTTLRTKWGSSTEYIRSTFGEKYRQYFEKNIQDFLLNDTVINNKENQYFLTASGKMMADFIATALFFEE